MKLKVGMYVRTNDGYINKIKKVNQFNVLVYGRDLFGEELNIPNNEITKASYNIIDILEVGDYLNGFKVSKIERYDTNTIIKIGNSTFNVLEGEKIYTPSYDNNNGYEKIEKLKSIVTKEQFEQMTYKVGGVNDNAAKNE